MPPKPSHVLGIRPLSLARPLATLAPYRNDAVLLALPVLVFFAHSLLFFSWIVDDAGISFAYARNLAQGHGLVPQPGQPPVEGFSNPLWVAIIAVTMATTRFDATWTPKLVSWGLVVAGYLLGYLALRRCEPHGRAVALAALSLLSLQTGFVVWSNSGLENALMLFVVVALFSLGERLKRGASSVTHLLAGLVTCAAAMTRPEGVLYALAYPIIMRRATASRAPATAQGHALALYAGTFALSFGAFLGFRWLYFGSLLPNPYLAKGGPSLLTVRDVFLLRPETVSRLVHLFDAFAGNLVGAWLCLLLFAALLMVAYRRALDSSLLSLVVFAVIAVVGCLMLPEDWMGEYRYATPVFFFVYCLALRVITILVVPSGHPGRLAAVVALCVVITTASTLPRSLRFAHTPTLPLTEVADTAARFERLAARLGVPHASILIADVGAFLLYSRLTVYDLGMLTNRRIALALGEGTARRDRNTFYDYVFDEAKPTFIATRAYHSWLARLDDDGRFRRDYVPIIDYLDEWVRRRYGVTVRSGDFVRRDAIHDVEHIAAMFKEHVAGAHYAGCGTCP